MKRCFSYFKSQIRLNNPSFPKTGWRFSDDRQKGCDQTVCIVCQGVYRAVRFVALSMSGCWCPTSTELTCFVASRQHQIIHINSPSLLYLHQEGLGLSQFDLMLTNDLSIRWSPILKLTTNTVFKILIKAWSVGNPMSAGYVAAQFY